MWKSRVVQFVVGILIPPVGLWLAWFKSGWRWPRKVVATLGLAIWSVAAMMMFFGLRIELNGGMTSAMFSFYRPETHFQAIEKSRAEQAKSGPAGPAIAVVSALPPDGKPDPEATRKLAEDAFDKLPSYWTTFRGPENSGIYTQAPTLEKWPEGGLKPIWSEPIGGGYASFVIAKGIAYTIEQRRKQEVVAAYVLATGRELWTHKWDTEFTEPLGGDGPRATPTYDNGRIYALGARGEFRCLSVTTGTKFWSTNILSDAGATNLQWAVSGAPLIVDDKVIVLPGGSNGKSVVAYNKMTGGPAWSALDDKASYVSPMLVTLNGKRQILVVTAHRIVGLAPDNGALLWEHPWQTTNDINIAQPIVLGTNRIYISAGYGHGSEVFELTPSADGKTETKSIWANTKMKNKFASAVLVGDYVYGLDESILACIDVRTGDLKWKGGRYGYGQIVLANKQIIVLTESGELALVEASPERYQEISRSPALTGKTWNVPAISDGILLVRNTTQMSAFRISR